MQLAPRPDQAPAKVVSRKKRAAIAGAAALSAGAIAITPIAAGPNIAMSQDRDVALTAAYQGYIPNPVVTQDPGTVYNGIFDITVNNLTGLGESIIANPFPLLTQIGENQQGYFERVVKAFETIQKNAGNFFSDQDTNPDQTGIQQGNGYVHGTRMLEAIEAGDIFTAYEEFNTMVLYSNTIASTPIAGLFLSTVPRGQTAEVPGIPAIMAQNVADAVNTLFNTKTVNNGIFYSTWSSFGGVPYEMARNISELSTAIQDQDFKTALNVVVNSPGMTVNALVNGFDYLPDDTCARNCGSETGVESWPGLFAPKGQQHPGGLIYQALTGMGQSVATSIDNTPNAPKKSLLSGSGLGLDKLKDALKLDGILGKKDAATATTLAKSAAADSSDSKDPVKQLSTGLKKASDDAKASVKKLTGKVESSVKKVTDSVKKAASSLSGNKDSGNSGSES